VYASDGLIEGRDREMNFNIDAGKIGQYVKSDGTGIHRAAPGKDIGNGNGATVYRFSPPGEKPLLFRPFYEAGGREAGTWRLTWMQYGID
jgi:hypothetical protein